MDTWMCINLKNCPERVCLEIAYKFNEICIKLDLDPALSVAFQRIIVNRLTYKSDYCVWFRGKATKQQLT